MLPKGPSAFPSAPSCARPPSPLALDMVAWLKAELTWIFAAITWATVVVAQGHSKGMTDWFIPLAVGVVFATSIYYIARMMALGNPNPDKRKYRG